MKQAAMYVRVSTSQQKEEETIESQKAALSIFAKSKGFEIPSKLTFEDNGISGATLARPSLDRLRDYASEGLFDHIFVLSPDRLSRKYAYQVLLLEEFRKNNVKVIFRNSSNQDTPEENMLVQMQGMFAEYERAQITERTRRGKKHKAKNGAVSVLTKASYGYRYIKNSTESQAYLEVNDKEASVIKIIFHLYVKERLSMGKIKKYLDERKINSPKGNEKWCRSTISCILKNSAYNGIAYYGKTEKSEPDSMRLPSRQVRIKSRITPKRASKFRDRSEWIEIPVPAIIEKEIFFLAQDLLKRNIKLSPRNTKEPSLLQGLISCKECGYCFKKVISGKKSNGYYYYNCSKRDSKCSNPGIRLKELDEAVWSSLIKTLESPELIKNEISRRISEIKNEPRHLKQKQLEKKLIELENNGNRLLDAFQAGHIEIDELGKRMSVLKREVNNTKRELVDTSVGLSKEQLLELTEVIEYFSKHLKKAQSLSIDEKRKILRMIIKEVQIGKDGIEVNHIIPIRELSETNQIACLCPRDGEAPSVISVSSLAFFLSPFSRLLTNLIIYPTLTRGATCCCRIRGLNSMAVKRPKHVAIGVSLW
jgi:site-specific DNA recombinase